MWKKRFLFLKKCLPACLILLFIFTFPSLFASADDNILDCIENPEQCEGNDFGNNEKDDAKENEKSAVGVTAWDYTRTIFALIFVVALLFGLLKFINNRNRQYDKNRLMKNMGGLSLGQHKSIQLVNVGNTYYLIGVGEEIRLLKEITDEKEIATLVEYYEEVDESLPTGLFNQLLTLITSRKNKKVDQYNNRNNEPQDFGNIFNTRLNEMKEERKRRLSQMTEKERDQDE